jgi:hypothetical protein
MTQNKHSENTETQSCKTGVMRGYFISEYEKFLKSKGIDTVCFMGYGYNLEEVKVGAEFYLSYLFWGRMSSLRNSTPKDVLNSVLGLRNYPEFELDDKFKLIQKYKYFDCKVLDIKNIKTENARVRREFVRIKNLRTGEIKLLKDEWIDSFYYFLFTFW